VWSGDFVSLLHFAASIYLLGLMLYLVFEPRLTNYSVRLLKAYLPIAYSTSGALARKHCWNYPASKNCSQAPGNAAGYRWLLIAIPVARCLCAVRVRRPCVQEVCVGYFHAPFERASFMADDYCTLVALFFVGVFGFLYAGAWIRLS